MRVLHFSSTKILKSEVKDRTLALGNFITKRTIQLY